MENMTQKASQMSAVMGVAATVPDILAIPGPWLHLIDGGGDDIILQWNLEFLGLHRIGCPWKFNPVETVKGFTDKDYSNMENGVKTVEVDSECWWMNSVGYANDHIDRIVKDLMDEGNALKFISVEMFKGLKDKGYGLKCIPIETMKELKDDGYGLKFISVDTVKMSKDDDCALKFIPAVMVKELKEDGYALFIPAETVKKLADEYNIKMESGGVIEAMMNKCWWKSKCIEYFGYANDYIEKTVKPEMGLLFSGATMQNIYQLVTSGMVNTGKGKTLMKLNEAAFMMLLYGLVMPRRAAGHIATAVGVALASVAYLVTMSYAF
ncbi:uncharacterized protein LOC141644054 [Silene latifolia]|uniref:uncharacterized protein LOC141644054 n=1 Tax=Silene latifolia TaxID=37657 RepID=UPI003D77C078